MPKALKIISIIVVALGLFSGIYLLFAQKKQPIKNQTNQQASVNANGQSSLGANIERSSDVPRNNQSQQTVDSKQIQDISSVNKTEETSVVSTENDQKISIDDQWLNCKAGRISQTEELSWPVGIIEEIPVGGSYAKGYLIGDPNMVVQVYIKAGADSAKVFDQLVQGRTAFLKGNCIGSAPNGAAKLEAF
jgi:hypothetical protein